MNTFGVDQQAARLLWAHSAEEILSYVKHHGAPALILGGGSNMLLTRDIEGDVLQVDIKKREVIQETEDHVWVELGAGENWHEVVLWTLTQGWGGLENLSLIPGNCGTAPVQNIGAYGVEIKDVLVSCKGVNMVGKSYFERTKEECEFGYRDSIFKRAWKGKSVITHITLQLTKRNHQLQYDYGSLKQYLEDRNITDPTPREISAAVVDIRSSKLPNPAELGNSGSFFKNPVISKEKAAAVKAEYPEMPVYDAAKGVKVAAGWLIEEAGWKGHREGDAGVHENQALVLVNHGKAKGSEILALSQAITDSVYKKFGISLQTEVNII